MDFVVARLLKMPLKKSFDKAWLHNWIYCKGLKIIQRIWKKKKKKKKKKEWKDEKEEQEQQ